MTSRYSDLLRNGSTWENNMLLKTLSDELGQHERERLARFALHYLFFVGKLLACWLM